MEERPGASRPKSSHLPLVPNTVLSTCMIALTSCSGGTDQYNSVCLDNLGLRNCSRANNSSVQGDFIQWCFSIVDYILLSEIWAEKEILNTSFIYNYYVA